MPLIIAGLLSSFATWLIEKLSNKAYGIAVATALLLLIATTILTIAGFLVSHTVPEPVLQALSVVAPADWSAQLATIMTVKSASFAYHQAKIFHETLIGSK